MGSVIYAAPWIGVLLGAATYSPLVFIGVSRKRKTRQWAVLTVATGAVLWVDAGVDGPATMLVGQLVAFALHLGKWSYEVIGDLAAREREGLMPLEQITEFQAVYSVPRIWRYRRLMNDDPVSRGYLIDGAAIRVPWADEADWRSRCPGGGPG